MPLEITRGYKQMVAEAEKEIETVGIAEALALHGSDDVVFVDLRDVRELKREGFVPGAFSAIIYALIITGLATVLPRFGPPVGGFSWRDRFASLPPALPIFFVVFIIIVFIYNPFGGDAWGTPTEGGAIGAFVVFLMAVWKGMRWEALRPA